MQPYARPISAPTAPLAPSPPMYVMPLATRRTLSTGLSGTLQGFFWTIAGLAGVASFLALASMGSFQAFWDTPAGSLTEARAFDDWSAIDGSLTGVTRFLGLSYIVTVVVLIVWMNHAHKVTQQLWSGKRTWSSGWTVGGWCIPIAQLVIPKLVLNEIEKISTAARNDGQVDETWRRQPTAATGWIWWVLFPVGWILNAIGGVIRTSTGSSSDTIIAGYSLSTVGLALIAIGALCGALYIRRVGKTLAPAAVDHQIQTLAPSPIPTAIGEPVRYSTATWTTPQHNAVVQALANRGVRHQMVNGDLVVDGSVVAVTNTIVAEYTATPSS